MKLEYEELFHVHSGLFTEGEIEKIRKTRVFIGGCGGVGGAMAIILTRSGVENFVLVDPGRFKPSNANRQITCFVDTLGRNKAEVTAAEMRRINPKVRVRVEGSGLGGIKEVLGEVDIAVPAADDFAWSIAVARAAGERGKPVVVAYPTGMLGRVTVVIPGQSLEEFFGIPPGLPYQVLKRLVESPRLRKMFRRELEFYKREGRWTEEWFERFLKCEVSLPQLCPVVWATACLGALEVLKLATGKFKPVIAPKHWHLTPEGASVEEFRPPSVASRLARLVKIGAG
jgi:molybdopterin/thiamine biosynthesis adenylyltransferase